jgi:arginase
MTIVEFRQWQGAGRRALPVSFHLGASLLLERFDAPVDVIVPVGDDRKLDVESHIVGRSSLLRQLRDASHLIGTVAGPMLVIGGDCSIDLAPIARSRRLDPRTSVVYFDAHADLNIPAESPSGALHGMVLRHVLGDGDSEVLAALGSPTPHSQVILVGARAFDDAEALFVSAHGISRIRPERVDGSLSSSVLSSSVLSSSVLSSSGPPAGSLHIHLDLDVLDPAEFPHTTWPEPGGPSIAAVAAALQGLTATGRVGSIAVTECIATRADQIDPLEPIIEVLRTWLNV